jgi:hypothetical protein
VSNMVVDYGRSHLKLPSTAWPCPSPHAFLSWHNKRPGYECFCIQSITQNDVNSFCRGLQMHASQGAHALCSSISRAQPVLPRRGALNIKCAASSTAGDGSSGADKPIPSPPSDTTVRMVPL